MVPQGKKTVDESTFFFRSIPANEERVGELNHHYFADEHI